VNVSRQLLAEDGRQLPRHFTPPVTADVGVMIFSDWRATAWPLNRGQIAPERKGAMTWRWLEKFASLFAQRGREERKEFLLQQQV
jgi:hypothetical protein